jgi:hypothetical protein
MVAKSPMLLIPAAALLVGSVLTAAAPASARAGYYPLDPAHNIPLTSRVWGPACTHHAFGARCERIMVRALNHARSVMGQPAYDLPGRFGALRGRQQLLTLANQDRKLYRRAPIAGLNRTLNASAERGAANGADPAFVTVGGRHLWRGGSNWAGGLRSPLAAYFMWMYDDAGSSWQHRHNMLMRSGGRGYVMLMGVGSTADSTPDWTTLFESFARGPGIQCLPAVLGLSARSADASRGSAVRLAGFGFLHVRHVTFGGVPASFTRTSLFSITAVPPPHDPGRVHVQVITSGGVSPRTRAAVYRY